MPKVTDFATAILPAARAIVTDALMRGAGGQTPTNLEYQERYGFSAGTIQRAIAALAERGALQLRSRAHLGRAIVSVNVGTAWQAASLPPIKLLLPPSGSVEVDVLQHILADELAGMKIPYTVSHLRGGARRLAEVDAGQFDLALVSDGVRKTSLKSGPFKRLAPGTYYAPGRLVIVRSVRRHSASMETVAIDRDGDAVIFLE